ncbi:AAA family ATPase, partial [Candidatus Woesearchaeota archaeon]|nr:AAA family ATPase [Candidatus Woesearchaeota archaeon]
DMERYSINPNNEVINSLVSYYNSGQLNSIYGNASSGKTTCCLLAAIEAVKSGKVVFVDTEGGFNTERLSQLCPGMKDRLENIFLIQPKSFDEQHDTILKLKKLCDNDKINLLIVDTIGHHYRKSLSENPKDINSRMAEQMATLVRIARDLNKVVLVTNQAGADMESKDDIKMVGGKFVQRLCKTIIELKKINENRYATLIKYKFDENKSHYNLEKKIRFEIKEKGLFILE